jgi:hypothetical protein
MQGKAATYTFFMRTLFVGVLVAACNFASFAQSDILHVYGTIKDEKTMKKMEGVRVTVKQNGQDYDAITTTSNGKYEFKVPLGYAYLLTFSSETYVAKKIDINTKGVPPEDMVGGFQLNMDLSLFSYIEGFDTSILDQPIGKAAFDPIRNSVDFDFDYTGRIKQLIDAEFARLAKQDKEMEKLIVEFNALVAKGDQAMSAKNYTEAVSKFEAALRVIPKRDPAPEKLAAAQAALDAENAAKDLEQRYQRFLADGKTNIGKKDFGKARDALVEASKLKPAEREPKDLLATIEKELAALEKRAQFDGIITKADQEFDATNYAVSIKKYQEALDLFPTEEYPRQRIKEAQKRIDDQLANAAAEEEKQRRFNEAIDRADKNVDQLEYESAINNYRAALDIKPGEKYPTDRIKFVEDLIAKAKKKDQDALAAADRNAAEALEKQYRDLIKSADDKFTKKDLAAARADYVAALEVKAGEVHPQARIERIDELLAEADQQAARERQTNDEAARIEAEFQAIIKRADAKFDAEDLEGARAEYEAALGVKSQDKYPKSRIQRINELLDQKAREEADRLAADERLKNQDRSAQEEADRLAREERQRQLDEEKRSRLAEEEAERLRLAEERALREEEARRRTSDFANNANTSTEDEAERYYREARLSEERAKTLAIEDKKQKQSVLLTNGETDAEIRSREAIEQLQVKEDGLVRIYRDGEMRRESQVDESEKVKAADAERTARFATEADRRTDQAFEAAGDKAASQMELAENDAYRLTKVEIAQERQELYASTIGGFISSGDSRRIDNEFDVKSAKEKMIDQGAEGELVRETNMEIAGERKDAHQRFETDVRLASDERKSLVISEVEGQKELQSSVGEGKEALREESMYEVERAKDQQGTMLQEKDEEARRLAYEKRRARFELTAGGEKSPDEYILPAGAENLEEGVQERSYKEGNKVVIERTVKRGNKVDAYRKVISKTGIYYFKNGKSITEDAWKRETLDAQN